MKSNVVKLIGLSLLVFSANSYSLPETKYTASCKFLSPTEGEYNEKGTQSITSESAYKKITAANEAYADEKYQESISILNDLIANSSDRVAKGRARTLLAQNYRALGRFNDAIKEFKAAIDSGFLRKQDTVNIKQIIASMYAANEDYDTAIQWLLDYFKDAIKPPATSYAMLASLYYQKEDLRSAICPSYLALKLDIKSKKGPYGMLMGAHIKLKDYAGAEVIGEEMIELFPKEKSTYNNLFAVYGLRDKPADMLALAELAYLNGMWQSEANYKQLSALYSNNRIPLLAAERLQEGVNKNIVESNEDNWKSIANSFYFAKAYPEAINAYKKAAQFTSSGKYDYNIGNIYFDTEDYKNAISSYQTAIRKGDLREGDTGFAYLQMGMAYQRLGQPDQAINALEQAKRFKNVSKNANAYIAYIKQLESMKKELALND